MTTLMESGYAAAASNAVWCCPFLVPYGQDLLILLIVPWGYQRGTLFTSPSVCMLPLTLECPPREVAGGMYHPNIPDPKICATFSHFSSSLNIPSLLPHTDGRGRGWEFVVTFNPEEDLYWPVSASFGLLPPQSYLARDLYVSRLGRLQEIQNLKLMTRAWRTDLWGALN